MSCCTAGATFLDAERIGELGSKQPGPGGTRARGCERGYGRTQGLERADSVQWASENQFTIHHTQALLRAAFLWSAAR